MTTRKNDKKPKKQEELPTKEVFFDLLRKATRPVHKNQKDGPDEETKDGPKAV